MTISKVSKLVTTAIIENAHGQVFPAKILRNYCDHVLIEHQDSMTFKTSFQRKVEIVVKDVVEGVEVLTRGAATLTITTKRINAQCDNVEALVKFHNESLGSDWESIKFSSTAIWAWLAVQDINTLESPAISVQNYLFELGVKLSDVAKLMPNVIKLWLNAAKQYFYLMVK